MLLQQLVQRNSNVETVSRGISRKLVGKVLCDLGSERVAET